MFVNLVVICMSTNIKKIKQTRNVDNWMASPTYIFKETTVYWILFAI